VVLGAKSGIKSCNPKIILNKISIEIDVRFSGLTPDFLDTWVVVDQNSSLQVNKNKGQK